MRVHEIARNNEVEEKIQYTLQNYFQIKTYML